MKPAQFTYHDPAAIADVVALLAEHEEARLLAGGQSLMPMMNFRFVQPAHLIDLNRVEELGFDSHRRQHVGIRSDGAAAADPARRECATGLSDYDRGTIACGAPANTGEGDHRRFNLAFRSVG